MFWLFNFLLPTQRLVKFVTPSTRSFPFLIYINVSINIYLTFGIYCTTLQIDINCPIETYILFMENMSYQRNICLISSILICTAIKFTNAANVYHHEIKYRSTGNEKMCVTESCIETANSLFKVSCDIRYF